jgi:hypothetical protein
MGVPVADLNFTLAEVTSLAQKLSAVQNLQESLTGPERDLLLAIFAAAADRAQVVNAQSGESTLPQAAVAQTVQEAIPVVTPEILKDQLLQAYIPGNYFRTVDPSQNNTRGDHTL